MNRLLLFWFGLTLSWAGVTGKVAGVVTEKDSGDKLPGVNIMVINQETEEVVSGAATGTEGEYSIINLQPGIYHITASAIGYEQVRMEQMRVSVDHTTRANFVLSVQALDMDRVTVIGKRNELQRDLTSSIAMIGSDEIEDIPVNSVDDILDLQAGMVRDASGDLHIRGGRSSEIVYMIDGVQVIDALSRKSGISVDNQAVQELQAITGTFNAEYGQALSGVINIVTKTGSPHFKGNFSVIASDYYSTDDIYSVMSNATWANEIADYKTYKDRGLYYAFPEFEEGMDADQFLEDKPYLHKMNYLDHYNPLNNVDYQFNLSGPLNSSKSLTYFLSGRYFENNGYNWGRRLFMPWGYQEPSMGGEYQWKLPDLELAPLDHKKQLTSQSKLFYQLPGGINLSYGYYFMDEEHDDVPYNYKYIPDASKTYYTTSQTHIFSLNHMLDNNTFYEVRLSYFKKEHENYLYADPNDYRYISNDSGDIEEFVYGENIDLNFVDLAGTIYDFKYFGNETDQGFNDVSYVSGKIDFTKQINFRHQIKMGLEARFHELENEWYNIQFSDNFEPVVEGIESAYHEHFYHEPREYSAYIQDKAEFSEIIFNLGLRLDYFDPDGQVLADPSDPQIYAPFKQEHIYRNWGEVEDEDDLIEYTVEEREEFWFKKASNKYQISPRFGVSFPVTDRGIIHFSYGHFFQNPAFRYLYSNPEFQIAGAGTNAYIGNADLDAERTVMYEVGLQQGIGRNFILNATGFYRDIRDWVGMSPPIETSRSTYQKHVNMDYAGVMGFTLTGSTSLPGITVKVDYTFMEAKGTTSDPLDAYYDALNDAAPRIEMVYLDWDETHTLNTVTTVRLGGWTTSLITKFNSGLPFTPEFSRAEVAGSSTFSGLTENSSRKPTVFNVDLRFSRSVDIGGQNFDFAVDIYNLLDNRSVRNVYADTGEASYTLQGYNYEDRIIEISNVEEYFAQPERYDPPRRIQLTLSAGF